MQQTLFFFPHWLFEGPLLIGWLVVGFLILLSLYFRHGNTNETWSFLPVYGIVAVVIYAVLPNLEVPGINPEDPTGAMIPSGLAIRGYGLFLLLAILLGVTLAAWRARAIGVTTDQITQLAFCMMVCGLAGARLFYVLQYPEDFFADGISLSSLLGALNMTKGGMVVFGSLIGGSIGGLIYLLWNRLPILRVADLIAPGMVLGLAIGRIGCLMNGCCYGGVCEAPFPGVTFPAGSPPYVKQLVEGDLLGIDGTYDGSKDADYSVKVDSVQVDSLADKLGFRAGDQLTIISKPADYLRFQKQNPENEAAGNININVYHDRLGPVAIPLKALPARSRRTHPTQIYSSVNALLLCALLWFYWTVRRNDGEVFGLMLILYSVARFLIEIIRQDESGQFGTELTISQWVSIVTIAAGFALFIFAQLQKPAGSPETDKGPRLKSS